MSDALLGPYAGLALALLGLFLFFKGRILSDKTVRREDFDTLQKVNASYAEQFKALTDTMDRLVTAVGLIHKNGGT